MSRQTVPLLVLGTLLGLAGVTSFAEDKSDQQAKQVAQQFLTAFKARDLDAVMKTVDVPWFNEGKKVLQKPDQVKAGFEALFTSKKDFASLSFAIKQVVPYETVRDSVTEAERELLDEVLAKTDRVLLVEVDDGKKQDTIILLIRVREGTAKVVGLKG